MGSPSDGILQKGNIVRKIGNYDCRDLRHKDALNLFQNAGSSINIVIERFVYRMAEIQILAQKLYMLSWTALVFLLGKFL